MKTKTVYDLMLQSGHSKAEVDDLLFQSNEIFGKTGLLKGKMIHYLLVAKHLHVKTPEFKTYSKYVPRATSIKISELKDIPSGNYIDIKGQIVNAFDDHTRISFNITDIKNVVRCSIFGHLVEVFKNKEFRVGDLIKIKNIKVKSFNGKKELTANSYTRFLKLKVKKNSV